jgi:hypothetical protein
MLNMIVDFPTFLSLITTLAILAGGIFGAIQLLQLRKQRARESALQMLNSAQTPAFMDAVHILFNIPEKLSKKFIEDYVGDKMNCVLVMFGTFESLGYLVFRHEISLELVDNFFGGAIVLFWKKFKNYFIESRVISKRENYGEWVQWLAEQLEKRESKDSSLPAHIQHRDWKEKK